jgi:hypothetical protein
MDALTLAIFTILGGAIGGFVAVFYNSYSSSRQEKALILLFVQEFMLLFRRCTMYYEQMLKGSVSFSTIYEATDAGTLEKLAEKISDHNVMKKIIKIKADFFQVIRWAHRASRTEAIDVDVDPEKVKLIEYNLLANKGVEFTVGESEIENTKTYIAGSIADMQSLLIDVHDNVPKDEEAFSKVEDDRIRASCNFQKVCG